MNTQKKLTRSRKDRMFGGVAAGLAEYFNIDISIMRLIMLFVILGTKGGLILYIVMWMVLPEADETYPFVEVEHNPESPDYV